MPDSNNLPTYDDKSIKGIKAITIKPRSMINTITNYIRDNRNLEREKIMNSFLFNMPFLKNPNNEIDFIDRNFALTKRICLHKASDLKYSTTQRRFINSANKRNLV